MVSGCAAEGTFDLDGAHKEGCQSSFRKIQNMHITAAVGFISLSVSTAYLDLPDFTTDHPQVMP